MCLEVVSILSCFSYSEQTPACAYTPVLQNQWTMTADPTDANSFPLGFRQGMFGEDNNPAFGVRCVCSQDERNSAML
jgi:hypothetical protein